MCIQLPNDAVSIGYKETSPFHHEQVFRSDSAGFTGTEREFLKLAGHAYEYVQIDGHTRSCVTVIPRSHFGTKDLQCQPFSQFLADRGVFFGRDSRIANRR